MVFMDFLWFVLLLSFGNGAHFKKNGAPVREVSKKLRLQHLSNGSRFFWQYVLPVRAPDLFSPYMPAAVQQCFLGFHVLPNIQNMQNGCGSAVVFVIYGDPGATEYAKRLRFRSGFCDRC